MYNDIAIENFISFCDEMMIAEEGLKDIGKGIWNTIIRIFRKAMTWFKNILMNINYFKNAQLSEQMNKDLLKVLQVSQARTEDIAKYVVSSYDILRIIKGKNLSDTTKFDGAKFGVSTDNAHKEMFRMTTLKDEMYKISVDIQESLDNAKDSNEYKRIMENDYKDEKKLIPLSNIIPDLKKCNTNLTTLTNQLDKMQHIAETANNNDESRKFVNKIITFLNRSIDYYQFRISLLSKYFTAAKASLTGTVNNIKELKNGSNKSSSNFKNGIKIKTRLKGPFEQKKIEELYKKAKAAETYEEYKPLYDELSTKLNCKGCVIEAIQFIDITTVMVKVADERNNTIQLAKGQKLYHAQTKTWIDFGTELKELHPTWKMGGGALCPTPRVYFHTNCPLDRYGNRADSETAKAVYVLKDTPSTAHIDREMGRTAVYIETTKPLPVEKLDYAEWRRINEIKFGLNDD